MRRPPPPRRVEAVCFGSGGDLFFGMGDSHVHDASFYELVHEVLDNRAVARKVGGRGSSAGSQSVAPWSGAGVPDADEFVDIECMDLSPQGMSFFSPDRTIEGKVVVRFASGEAPIYLLAEVVHQAATFTTDGPGYRIGCKFTSRLEQ